MKNKTFFSSLVIMVVFLTVVLIKHKTHLAQYASTTGATYYVSRNGTNADGLSWTSAWSDVNKINWSVIQPGDTIVIDGGATSCPSNYDFISTRPGVSCGMLYNSTLTIGKSGTASAPITIKLATDTGHNGTAVFFGGRATPLPYCGQTTYAPQTVGTGLRVGISIGNYQYVVLDGGKRSGFMIYGYEDPTNGDGLGIQFTSNSASNITVRNMEIFDNGIYTTINKSGSPINGRYNSDSKGIEPVGNNLTFERLLIHDNGQDEFQSGGSLSNVTIQDSWMYARRSNPSYPGFGFNSGPYTYGCTHEDGVQVYGGGVQSGLTFKNDIFGPLLDQGIYPSDIGVYFNNVTINNILFLGNAWNNINVDPQNPSTVPTGWNIQNITAYDDPSGFDTTAGQCNVEVLSGSGMTVTNSIFKNGCIHMSQFSGSGNIYYNTSNIVPGGINTDPQFQIVPPTNTPSYDDYALANFTPKCSTCSNAGSSLHSYQDILNDIDQLNATAVTPTPTPTATPTYVTGDINHSGCINILDFNLWLQAYQGHPVAGTFPDVNSDGVIDILDFNAWLTTIQTLFNTNPTDPRLCST